MPIIQAGTGIITQINVFTVPAGGQDALIDYLAATAQTANRDAAQRVIDHLHAKGLIAGNKCFGVAHAGLYEVALTLER